METLATAFRLGQVVVLAATLPLAVVAARGYHGTPFGRVVRSLVPIAAVYLLVAAGELLFPSMVEELNLVLGSVALVLVAWTVLQLVLLLTERREL